MSFACLVHPSACNRQVYIAIHVQSMADSVKCNGSAMALTTVQSVALLSTYAQARLLIIAEQLLKQKAFRFEIFLLHVVGRDVSTEPGEFQCSYIAYMLYAS